MSKSISAALLSELLKLYPKQTAEKTENDLAAALQKGEKPSLFPIKEAEEAQEKMIGKILR